VGSVVERDDFGLACTLSGFAVDIVELHLGAAVGSSPSAGIQAAVAV
jgi:hypothetical protein